MSGQNNKPAGKLYDFFSKYAGYIIAAALLLIFLVVGVGWLAKSNDAQPAVAPQVAQTAPRAAPAPAAPAPAPRAAPATASKAAEGNEVYTGAKDKAGEETSFDLSSQLIHISRNGFRFCDAADPDICPWQMLDRDGHVTGHFDSLEDGVLDFTLADPAVAGQALFHDKVGESVNRTFRANGEDFGRVRVYYNGIDNEGIATYRVDFIFCGCDGTAEQERSLWIKFGSDGLATSFQEHRVYDQTWRTYTRFVP